jgi:hypothetical protein
MGRSGSVGNLKCDGSVRLSSKPSNSSGKLSSNNDKPSRKRSVTIATTRMKATHPAAATKAKKKSVGKTAKSVAARKTE